MGILDRITSIFTASEKRSTKSYIDPKRFFANAASGAVVNSKTALGFTPVFCAVKLLSESISQIPIEICERQADGNIIKRDDHALSKILTLNPNHYQTKIDFFSKVIVDLCLHGNSYVYIERNNSGIPISLYCLKPENINIKHYENDLYYTDRTKNTTYSSKDILHFKSLSVDGYQGVSPISQCKNAIGWGLAVETYGNTFFSNGAKLSGVLSTDRQMSELAIERLRRSFQEQYASLNDANKTLILEEGLKFQQVSISNEQAQFLSSRDMAIQEVARVFNLPPHMLKDLSKSSFNNIEQQSTEFVRYSVMPYLSNMEAEMNLKLFRADEQGKVFTNFDANSLLRGSPNDRATFYEKMVKIGAMTINEVREKENMNKVDNGGILYLPSNLEPITDDDNSSEERKELRAKIGSLITEGLELPLFDNEEEAIAEAEKLGGDPPTAHEHTVDGETYYMPFADHEEAKEVLDRNHHKKKKKEYKDHDCKEHCTEDCAEDECKKEDDNYGERALADIDRTPTAGMVREAKKGLEWRKEFNRGGTMVGVSRARDIINGDLSLKSIKRMFSFFSRHEVDKKAQGFRQGEEGYPSAGRIAWALWGGDPGFAWSRKKVAQIKKEENADS
tara:strand:+ start:2521 stop:4377 length:1857 start_codon:yes stop_codon:yes gene_type:complete